MENTEALIREGKRKLLSLSHGVQAVADWHQISELLDHYDTNVIHNKPPETIGFVLFLLTRMVRFSGGQTSILRIGTELAQLGLRVGYAVYKTQSKEEMKLVCEENLPGYEGEVFTKQDVLRLLADKSNQPEVVIASSWDTVHYVKKFKSYLMYFVQDFEPYFYTYGERYLLAKKTYEQGLHMVSLGKWNRKEIVKQCLPISPIDCIDFPCDISGYPCEPRDFSSYSEKKVLTLAVYLKYYGKRLPSIIQYMLLHLKEELLKKDGITLEVKYFGEAKSFIPKAGVNLGMLSAKELSELYRTADFGMVASMSNISLVPFEMLASGLPLIEFEDGTFSDFFPKGSALLTSISWRDLYRKLVESLKSPELIEARDRIAGDYIATLSWEKTGKQFYQILRNLNKN